MDRLEKLQYNYTKLITEVRNQSYEDRLKSIGISSLQRRLERYKIFYMWKIRMDLVPNCGIVLAPNHRTRSGIKYLVPVGTDTKEGRLRDQTFQVSGPRIWNSLPCFIRNTNYECFIEFKTGG